MGHRLSREQEVFSPCHLFSEFVLKGAARPCMENI